MKLITLVAALFTSAVLVTPTVVDAYRLPDGRQWDPVPVATELLAVGARLHGLPANRAPESTDIVTA